MFSFPVAGFHGVSRLGKIRSQTLKGILMDAAEQIDTAVKSLKLAEDAQRVGILTSFVDSYELGDKLAEWLQLLCQSVQEEEPAEPIKEADISMDAFFDRSLLREVIKRQPALECVDVQNSGNVTRATLKLPSLAKSMVETWLERGEPKTKDPLLSEILWTAHYAFPDGALFSLQIHACISGPWLDVRLVRQNGDTCPDVSFPPCQVLQSSYTFDCPDLRCYTVELVSEEIAHEQ